MIHRILPRLGAAAVLLATLSSCKYLIPEDQSAPRYNQVFGARHRPERNQDGPQSALTDSATPQPAAPFSNAAADPVKPAIPTSAPDATIVAPVAVNNLPPPDVVMPSDMTALPIAQNTAMPERQVPLENMQYAENAPLITDVPPRPPLTGSDSAQSRLDAARRDLEQDRANAEAAKAQLSRDVSSEPAMAPSSQPSIPQGSAMPMTQPVAPYTPPPSAIPENTRPIPQTMVPPPYTYAASPPPMTLTPLPPPPTDLAPNLPLPTAQPMPPMASTQPVSMQPMPPIRLTPPGAAPVAPTPVQRTPFAVAPVAMAPIQLTAPQASGTPVYSIANVNPTLSGGFDPLAVSAASSTATKTATNSLANSDFLPPSRYASRHSGL